jgi:hypothetical protein
MQVGRGLAHSLSTNFFQQNKHIEAQPSWSKGSVLAIVPKKLTPSYADTTIEH